MKRILARLLRPRPLWTALAALAGSAALAWVFLGGHEREPIAPVLYALSAYALTVVAARAPALFRRAAALVRQNRYGGRFLEDLPFRTMVSLYATLAFNLAYALFKLAAGVLYASAWNVAVAVYYFVVSSARFVLLRRMRRAQGGRREELLDYRRCGLLLFALNAALGGMTVQMIHSGRGARYPGKLIYAAAAYAFYSVAAAIVGFVKYRGLDSPTLSAAKSLGLSTAPVALFSLQTAMFDAFGGTLRFQAAMNAAAGMAVCAWVFALAVYMVARAGRELKKAAARDMPKGQPPI